MKYAIVKCTDTNFAVHGEYPTLEAAKVAFHQYSAALWNDPGTAKAMVKIVDEQLDCVEGYMELVLHPQEASNEPEETGGGEE